MTLIELWYFMALLGASVAGVFAGYQSGSFALAAVGSIVGLVVAICTICGSMLPNVVLNRLGGLHRVETDKVSDRCFALLALVFALSIFATPIVAVWLTALCVQWLGSWWLAGLL